MVARPPEAELLKPLTSTSCWQLPSLYTGQGAELTNLNAPIAYPENRPHRIAIARRTWVGRAPFIWSSQFSQANKETPDTHYRRNEYPAEDKKNYATEALLRSATEQCNCADDNEHTEQQKQYTCDYK